MASAGSVATLLVERLVRVSSSVLFNDEVGLARVSSHDRRGSFDRGLLGL